MLKNVSYSRKVWLVQADKICNTPTSALHLALYIEGKKVFFEEGAYLSETEIM